MKIITVEEHYSSKELLKESQKYADENLTTKRLNKELEEKYYEFSKGVEGLYNMDTRMKFMEDNGISMQILSFTNSLSTNIPKDK